MDIFSIIDRILPIVDKIIPDKAAQDSAKAEIMRIANEAAAKELEAEANIIESKSKVIIAEAQSESPAARNWRPHLMYLIMAILGYNWLIAPLLSTTLKHFGLEMQIFPIPPDMWTLLTISVGGYVVGRSGERMIDTYSQSKVGVAEARIEEAKFDAKRFYELYKGEMGIQNLDQKTVDAIERVLIKSGVKR